MRSAIILAALTILAAGCGRHEKAASPASLPAVRVQLATVAAEDLPQITEVSGTILPIDRAVVAAKVMGTIRELPVSLGQKVAAGDVLAQLFSEDAEARVEQARAQLNTARRDFERESALLEKGASTDETVKSLRDRVTANEAALRDAEVQLGYTTLRAPFDGVVASKWVNAGDLASPGQRLFAIEGASSFEVDAAVPESLASGLSNGAPIECVAGDAAFVAKVREISSKADAATRSVAVKLAVPSNAQVRSGQFATLRIPGAAARTLLVPATAVSLNGQMERVFVAGDGNAAAMRIVKSGAHRGDRVEILSGLNAGERVVVAPPSTLRDGQPLEVQP